MKEHGSPSSRSAHSVRSTGHSPAKPPDLLRLVQRPSAPSQAALALAQVARDPWSPGEGLSPPDTHKAMKTPQPSRTHAKERLQASLEHNTQNKELVGKDNEVPDVSTAFSSSTESAREVRRVCFDERIIHKHQAQRNWHYEARIAQRPSAQAMVEKRHHMDSFIQQLQSQIETAGQLLSGKPVEEPLSYRARSGEDSPVLVQHASRMTGLMWPSQWTWRVSAEIHAPILSSPARATHDMYTELMAHACHVVERALRARALSGAQPERVNAVLQLCPTFVLHLLHNALSEYTLANSGEHTAALHERWSWDMHLATLTLPTLVLSWTKGAAVTVLELTLVFTQLYLAMVLTIVRRCLLVFHVFLE